jgi:hypothetical protein
MALSEMGKTIIKAAGETQSPSCFDELAVSKEELNKSTLRKNNGSPLFAHFIFNC